MSPRAWMFSWVLLSIAAIIAIGSSLSLARRAEAAASVQLASFRSIAADVHELATLRAAMDPATESASNSAKLTPMVSAALGTAGLPATTLASLSPESESLEVVGANGTSNGEHPLRSIRRRATLVLTPLTLPQLGRFLSTWREHADSAQWTISRLDIEPRRDQPAPPGSDLPLRVIVGLESVALQPAAVATTPLRGIR